MHKRAGAPENGCGTERWVACKTCQAFILMPTRGEPPPMFRTRCEACKAQAVYLRTDVFERPRRTH